MINKDIKFIGVPISVGSPTRGTEKAFDKVEKYFNVKSKKIECANKEDKTTLLAFSKASVMDCNEKLFDEVTLSLKSGSTPFVIGGDHSIGIGSVLADTTSNNDVLVVWIDAHTDINTTKSSESHYIHGMPNAVSLGICPDLQMNREVKYLDGKNLVVLGARSIDEGEFPILQNNDVGYYSVEEIRDVGFDKFLASLKEQHKNKKVHISFDVDCLNPDEFASTGYNIKNGFTVKEVKDIIKFLTTNYELSVFDCVEYNPDLDSDNKDLKTLISILKFAIENI